MGFWEDKRVLVTGGAGFLGSFVVEKLKWRGCGDIFVPRSREYNLVEMQAVHCKRRAKSVPAWRGIPWEK